MFIFSSDEWKFFTELNLKFSHKGKAYVTSYFKLSLPLLEYIKSFPNRSPTDLQLLKQWLSLYQAYSYYKSLLNYSFTLPLSLETILFQSSGLINDSKLDLTPDLAILNFKNSVLTLSPNLSDIPYLLKLYSALNLTITDTFLLYYYELSYVYHLPLDDLLLEWFSAKDQNEYTKSKLISLKHITSIFNSWWQNYTSEQFKLKFILAKLNLIWTDPFSSWIEYGWSSPSLFDDSFESSFNPSFSIPLSLDYKTAKKLYYTLMKKYHPDSSLNYSENNKIICQEINSSWNTYKIYHKL